MIESGNVSPAVSVGHMEGLQVLEVLGVRGATSIGYRVTDGERMLFMKRLRPELIGDERMRMAFRKEYEVGRRVHSPHVVHYVDLHESDDEVYILMEYVAGETLLARLSPLTSNPSPLTFTTVRTWFVQILEGLRALHREGIVHLDIKPDNLLIADVNQHLVIADLGYCHQDSYLAPVGKTRGYAAPELDGKGAAIDVRADIYSAGRVLQEMLRGLDTADKVQDALRQISEKCCAEDSADRYASADEVLSAVASFPDEGEVPFDMLRTSSCAQPLKRSKVLSHWKAIVLAVLLAGLGGFGFWHFRHVGYYFGMEFRVTSTDSMTCEVVGPADRTLLGRLLSPPPSGCESHSLWESWKFVDAPIPEKIAIGSQAYRVTSVADSAFAYVMTLGAVTFPPSIHHIGAGAFKDCKGLSSLTLPDSLESFGGFDVFRNCEGLETVRLPKRLRTLAPCIFVHCLVLKDLVFPDSLKVLPEHSFMSCKSLTEVRIPTCVRTIERGVFWDCQKLQSVSIPASVETIADYAFGECPALTDVYVEWPRPIIVADIFARSHPRIHVPHGTADLYRKAPVWKNYEIVEM